MKFDEILIQSIAHIDNPHAASNEIKKNAYALAITNCLFEPYAPFSLFNSKKAIALLNEAKNQEINFDMSNFLANLPQEAKNNLAKRLKIKPTLKGGKIEEWQLKLICIL